uniref:U3 small nucleolar RNA-associated protein 15 homolog n=1 Tax=Bursaphelenchus xylophilus TaxID=6326 RepID=A0A1I7SDU8_BURXY
MAKPLTVPAEYESRISDDVEFWSRMKEVAVFQEPGIISSVDFSPQKPYHLAVANSNRTSLFDTSITQPVWFQSRFRSNVFGLNFRKDGKLLGMGTLDGYVHFFDVTKNNIPSRHALRVFKAHDSEVRCVQFPTNTNNCATFGDDGNLKVWDLALSKQSEPLYKVSKAHSDRIRASASSSRSSHLLASGSYDHVVKLWDTRQQDGFAQIVMKHEAPVEKILFSSHDRIIISAGGNVVKFWDLAAGGRLIQTLENHNRTVTSLALSQDGKYLLTGGLDRRIHVFRIDQGIFSMVYTISTAAPVLSMDLSDNDDCLAFGMNNLLNIQRREVKFKPATGHKRNIVGTGKQLKSKNPIVQYREGNSDIKRADFTAKHVEQIHLGRLDVLLRGCQFRRVVDQVMQNKKLREEQPELVVAALNQLKIRGVLSIALAGRQGPQLRQILGFVSSHFFRPSFFDVLFEVAHVIFNIYVEEDLSKSELSAVRDLRNQIKAEIACQQSMLRVCGIIESLWKSNEDTVDDEESDVFGEVIITPKIYTLKG